MPSKFKPILIAFALILPLAGPALAQQTQQRTLTVNAEGRVAATPDVVYIQLGVSEDRATAQEALNAMSLATDAMLDRLAAAGIAPGDVQTGQLSLNPLYGSSTPAGAAKVTGFQASTMLNVRVFDTQIVGRVLDAVVEDGANRLDGIRFDVAEPEPHLDVARIAAVTRARAKADLFATAAGVTLGPLLSLTEQAHNGAQPLAMEMRMMADATSVPIAGGEVNLTASVTLVYAIE